MLRRLLPPTTGVGAALLVVCVTIVLTACTTPSPRLDPEPASIAWHATDFRIITRTVDGVERTLYTVLVHAVLNHQEPVTLLLDTGATRTLLTPDTARRLGNSPEPDAPKSSIMTLGAHQKDLPLMQLASLAVEDAVVEGLQVGVCTTLPHA